MKKFYCIYEKSYKGISERIASLKKACFKYEIEFILLNSTSIDYRNLPVLTGNDFLYNIARGGEILETLLLNEQVITFYVNNPDFVINNSDTTKYSMIHQKVGLSSPKTIFNCTNNRILLKKYVEFLEGFPIVIKASGGTLGIGTILSNDFKSLFSLTDYLTSLNKEFIMRQYICPKEVARLIVVGSKVIASNQKFVEFNDFRTSVKNTPPLPKLYSQDIQQLAVKASHLANFETCGADIIIDRNDIPYLLEVNMPHDFVTTERVTGMNIAEIMLQHLVKKSIK